LGDRARTIECYERALVICEKLYGKGHPETIAISQKLKEVQSEKGSCRLM